MSSSALSTGAEKPWIITEINANRVSCKWTISTSELLCKKIGEAIVSLMFYTGNGEEHWRLELCLRPLDGKSISLFMNLETSERLGVNAQVDMEIMKSKDMIVKKSFTHTFDKLETWGWPAMIQQSQLLSLECSKITINCTTVISNRQNVSFESNLSQLNRNLRHLFENPKFSDVTIIVGDVKFPAHKNILSVRSSVFAAMFDHEEMDENRKNEVKIEDMEPSVIKGLLEYIYTGAIIDLKGLAKGLLGAAEKYDLQGLKATCEKTLSKNQKERDASFLSFLSACRQK